MYKIQFRHVDFNYSNVKIFTPWQDYSVIPVKADPLDLIFDCELFYQRNWGVKFELVPVDFRSNLFEVRIMIPDDTTIQCTDWQFRVVPDSVADGEPFGRIPIWSCSELKLISPAYP